jgi:hypothetical protein
MYGASFLLLYADAAAAASPNFVLSELAALSTVCLFRFSVLVEESTAVLDANL